MEDISLYKELLLFSKKIKDDFLKNVPIFYNQLSFDELNEMAYKKMYLDILATKDIKKTTDFYAEIPGLQDLYKAARAFYLKPRNKSVKGLDVQLGQQFENVFIDFLKSKGINAMHADNKNKKLPDIMVLDKTRNISAYIELKYHNAPFILSWRLINREPYEGSITMDSDKLKKQLVEIESELERPVFFVHWVDFPDLKGIFFNTNEQINEYLNSNYNEFERKDRDGDYKLTKKVGYTEKFYPPLHEMGSFNELMKILKTK
jgi:hypothetical protein